MKYITLQEIIDDILLLVRNNNISESEDLSRAQIAAWVKHYRHHLWKERKDQLKDRIKSTDPTIQNLLSLVDDEFFYIKETEHKLVPLEEKDGIYNYTRRTEDTFEDLFDDSWKSILAIHDEDGENIQYMNHIRRHYHNFRKYTFGELTAYYMPSDKHVYVQGLQDQGYLEYIKVLALYERDDDENDGEDDDDGDADEDKIKIPGWMVPLIKERIMKNELAFMLNRPSDDANNSTLASVKPNGPQDQEK